MPQQQKKDEISLRDKLKHWSLEEQALEESEPYLGPAWAVAMFILYIIKRAFPAEEYSFLWWMQLYVIGIVLAVTVFTLVKRHQFYQFERKRREKDVPSGAKQAS